MDEYQIQSYEAEVGWVHRVTMTGPLASDAAWSFFAELADGPVRWRLTCNGEELADSLR